jgi:hypothetical protein
MKSGNDGYPVGPSAGGGTVREFSDYEKNVPSRKRLVIYFPDWKGSQSKPQISLCNGIL